METGPDGPGRQCSRAHGDAGHGERPLPRHSTSNELGSKTAPFGLEAAARAAGRCARPASSQELLLRSGFTGAVRRRGALCHRRVHEGGHRRGSVPRPSTDGGQPQRRQHDPGPRRRQELPLVLGRGRPRHRSRSDGPDGFRLAVREEIKQGAEIIKMFVTGGHGTVAPSEQTEMTPEEITAGIEAAHQRGVLVRGQHRQLRSPPHGARCRYRRRRPRRRHWTPWPLHRAGAWSSSAPSSFLSQLFPVRFAEHDAGGGLASEFTAAMAEDIEQALAISAPRPTRRPG